MAYVYRHIRLDKNVPFYIGIGADSDGKYLRAVEKRRRNNLWWKIYKKAGYEVEILMDEITWDFAGEKEREFIQLYGRLNNRTGTLANLTDGGGGALGLIVPKEVIEKDRERKSIPIAQYDLTGKFIKYFPSLKLAANSFGKNTIHFHNYKEREEYGYGFYWKVYSGDSKDIIISDKQKISSFDGKGDYIKSYNNKQAAAADLGIHINSVANILRGKTRSTRDSIRLKIDKGDYSNIGAYSFKYYNPSINTSRFGAANTRSKKVEQIDRITMKVVCVYNSTREAGRAMGLKSKSQISSAACGKIPSAANYLWKYVV